MLAEHTGRRKSIRRISSYCAVQVGLNKKASSAMTVEATTMKIKKKIQLLAGIRGSWKN